MEVNREKRTKVRSTKATMSDAKRMITIARMLSYRKEKKQLGGIERRQQRCGGSPPPPPLHGCGYGWQGC